MGFVGLLLLIVLAYVLKGKERQNVTVGGYGTPYDSVQDRTRMNDISMVSMEPARVRRVSSKKVAPLHDPVADMAL